MTKLIDDPHFIEGIRKGKSMIQFIDKTSYQTVENALIAKKQLGELLVSELSYTLKDPKYAENLGIIYQLEQELKKKE